MIIKTVLDKRSKTNDGKFPVKLRFSDKGKEVYYNFSIYAFTEEFDTISELFVSGDKNTRIRNSQYNSIINSAKEQVNGLIVEAKKNGRAISITELKESLLAIYDTTPEKEAITFNDYFKTFISHKKGRTAEIYASTLNKITSYAGKPLRFEEIDKRWLNAFDEYMSTEKIYSHHKKKENRTLLKVGLEVNARSLHFRNIRAVFNAAIDDEVTELNLYPFRKFKIKREETVKRAMKTEDIKALFSYAGTDTENWAIDIAKIIFYAIGINVKDLFYLEDFEDTLTYKRAKTGRLYNIPVEPELAILLNKYRDSSSSLVFKKQFQHHTSFGKKVNTYLGEVCEKLKISKITTYSLRHTWATIAAKLEIPTETIAKALGHGKKTVTDVYIDFDMFKVEVANRKVIDYVCLKEEVVIKK